MGYTGLTLVQVDWELLDIFALDHSHLFGAQLTREGDLDNCSHFIISQSPKSQSRGYCQSTEGTPFSTSRRRLRSSPKTMYH